ncbi:MAG: hypothetical protein J5649_08515 [Lachnospiraceae bacterium]|nr:hypothetical protein [Lachnospiraceae bacterium]
MEEKKLIDQTTVQEVQRGHTRGYRFALGFMIVAAAELFILAPGIGYVLGAICVVIIVLMVRYRKKSGGVMQVYFSRREVTDKRTAYHDSDEGGTYDTYHLAFGEKSFEVNESDYEKAYVGEPYYVMYHAYNNRIVKIYEVAKYDLDPSLDIRP